MVRPRWHDMLIVVAVVGLLVVGIWALWWDDVRQLWHPESAPAKTPAAAPQT